MSHKENLKVVFMRGTYTCGLSIQAAISQCLIDEVTIQTTTTHLYIDNIQVLTVTIDCGPAQV